MNEIQIFDSSEFGKIRTVTINGEPWFVGKDVAEALGYDSPRSAVSKKIDAEDKGVAEMETPSGKQDMTIINESGLYSLIMGSKLPSAKKFKRWVTSEVLPAIRRTGGYGIQTGMLMEITQNLMQTAQMIVEATASITQSVNRMVDAVGQLTGQTKVETKVETSDCYSCRCKLETFPEEITKQVDEMLGNMLQQQNLNFSMIARFCTVNGYSISQPSVKRYFQKHFSAEF